MGGMGGVVTPSAASPPEGRVPRKKRDSGEALPSDIPGWPLCGDSGLVWAPGGHLPHAVVGKRTPRGTSLPRGTQEARGPGWGDRGLQEL